MLRSLIKPACEPTAKTFIPESVSYEGGVLTVLGGAIIDGQLSNVFVKAVGETVVQVSVMAHLQACIIHAHHVLIEGHFEGEITTTGDCEIGATAIVMGKINCGGKYLIHRLATTQELYVYAPRASVPIDSETELIQQKGAGRA